MLFRKEFTIITVVLIALLLSPSFALPAPSAGECNALKTYIESLTDATFNKAVTNVSVTWVPASGSTLEHCVVQGRIWPETDVQVKLPTAWNGRYFQVGGGGVNGSVSTSQLNYYLSQSYAAAGSTGGHSGAIDSGPEYGLKEPHYSQWFPGRRPSGNLYADQMLIDFGHRSLMETYTLAQKVISSYYGKGPLYSYFYGCSNGGKEGLVIAQKYPDLFDGIIVGSPVGSNLGTPMRRVWGGYWASKGKLTLSQKAIALNQAVYGKCDSVDGLVDGLIDDPQRCHFDPITDLPACADESDTTSSTCFTLTQRQALKSIYGPPMNSLGEKLYVGQSLSAEYLTNPTNPASSGFGAALSGCPSCDIARYWFFDPPFAPSWDWTTFDWDIYPPLMRAKSLTDAIGNSYLFSKVVDPVTFDANTSPNMGGLRPFKGHGGKLIQFHGWADSTVPPLISTNFYTSVLASMGNAKKTKSFYKLYMVPGMGHCGGGVGCFNGDMGLWTSALVNWVENGVESHELIGSRNSTPYQTARTRPLCPYPQVARYNGTGSIEDAANFICVPPIEVRIKPETLSLKSKGVFTAFITVPRDYRMRDWNLQDVTCEGASAKLGFAVGNVYTATFRTQDLQDVSPGKSVILTVKGKFQRDGKDALVQASDTVKVIK
jgi:hypothetical protein